MEVENFDIKIQLLCKKTISTGGLTAFTKGVTYDATRGGGKMGSMIHVVDETGCKRLVAWEKSLDFYRDKFFKEHFIILTGDEV